MGASLVKALHSFFILYMVDINEVLKHYKESENYESYSFCVGAQRSFDLSQFGENEIIFSHRYDTYCVIYFCGMHKDCLSCEKFKKSQ